MGSPHNQSPLAGLFVNDVPLLDVRAEVEFEQGAFPCAVNMPILNTSERKQVGICYKHKGPDAAYALGHKLVSGLLREQRIKGWVDFIDNHPGTHLYCFRGGQRSRIAVEWLASAGIEVPRIEGGYKAMRRFLIDSLTSLPSLLVLAGKTGGGKTVVLEEISRRHCGSVVDLEHRANHRGSAFGKRLTPQPTQINFENAVAIDFLKAAGTVMVEDEGKMIGRLNLPLPLQEKMGSAPVLVLEADMQERVQHIFEEYVLELWEELKQVSNDAAQAFTRHEQELLGAIDAIRGRLGGAHHKEIRGLMEAAFSAQARGDFTPHRLWIEQLLNNYYDPMYEYQLGKKSDRIRFRGDREMIVEYASNLWGRSKVPE